MSLPARNALIALGITILIVGTVAYAINYLNTARIEELSAIESQLSIDTLSLDTQFNLLAAAPCDSADQIRGLSSELSDLGDRLSYTENQLGSENTQVIRLKQQYTLLEIRDYLITKQLATACKTNPVTVLYFYSNSAGECSSCDKAGYTLSYLRNTYPNLRVYSFDYRLKLGALATLESLLKLKAEFPAFVIQGKTTYGFTTLENLEKKFPPGALATSTATTTKK
ncbi:MAG TPA: hypothetical protein VM103_02990 [Candidatus Paceibacterota bacterium]|nr:hypothetical protein [Candidatus Paceibacterota bacterium]